MSTVTTLLNLVKPASPEQFSLATYNNNLDLIDAAFPQIDYASSTFSDANWDMVLCKFTRFRMGTKGIVVLDMVVSLRAVAVPANTATPTALVNFIPSGYNGVPGASVPMETATTANSGTGSLLHVGLRFTDRAFVIRSGGAGFTLVAGSTLTWHAAYRWDGAL